MPLSCARSCHNSLLLLPLLGLCLVLLSVGVCLMGPDCHVPELWQREGLCLQQPGLPAAVPGGEPQWPHGPDAHGALAALHACVCVTGCSMQAGLGVVIIVIITCWGWIRTLMRTPLAINVGLSNQSVHYN